jgi:WD40 repeat protein
MMALNSIQLLGNCREKDVPSPGNYNHGNGMHMKPILLRTLIAACALSLPSPGYCDSVIDKVLGSNNVAIKVAELSEQYHDVIVGSVAFSPDGSRIAVQSDGQKINIWNWSNRQIDVTVEKPRGGGMAITTNALQYSPNGELLATCHTNAAGGVSNRIWETAHWSIAKDIVDSDGGACNAIGFTPDGHQFLRMANRYAGKGNTLIAYAVDTWIPIWGLGLQGFSPISVGVNPQGSLIALGGTVMVAPSDIHDPIKRIQATIFQPKIQIVDWQNRQVAKVLKSDAMGPMAWSSDGLRLAVVGQLYVEMFDVQTGANLVHEKLAKSGQMNVRFTPDGRYFIESDLNGMGHGLGVKIWDSARHKLLQTIPGDMGSIDVSKDSKYLAVGTTGHTTIWQFK